MAMAVIQGKIFSLECWSYGVADFADKDSATKAKLA
jgi:hypothetical protein